MQAYNAPAETSDQLQGLSGYLPRLIITRDQLRDATGKLCAVQ
jgi:hypothetical protein